METIGKITLVGSVVISFIMTTLIVIFILKNKKYEIAVYTSLEEKKKNIFYQLLAEIFVLALVGITVALIPSQIMTQSIANRIIKNELAALIEAENPYFVNTRLSLFKQQDLTVEEAIEIFNVTFLLQDLALIYGITLVPITGCTYIIVTINLKKSPKKL